LRARGWVSVSAGWKERGKETGTQGAVAGISSAYTYTYIVYNHWDPSLTILRTKTWTKEAKLKKLHL
jgi:hypothetical protein